MFASDDELHKTINCLSDDSFYQMDLMVMDVVMHKNDKYGTRLEYFNLIQK